MPATTLLTDLASGETMVMRLGVAIRGPNDRRGAGRRIPLRPGTLVIGSGRDVDVVLDDPSVSRRHATLELVPDGVRVRDLGSKNGTRLDGVEVKEALAGPSAVLEVGDTTLAFFAEGERLDVGEGLERLGDVVAHGPAMRRVLAVLSRAARADVTVLLLGESGVGKDVLARAVHAHSPRKGGAFVVVDCGAMAPTLISSALFGHRRGAFTGAHEDRPGAFEAAQGGTVFLDEIGELPLELQPALLRVLESRQVTRVGENQPRPLDVRIVAATNRDLAADVKAQRFRADLYFRLAVVSVKIPPLRERADEVPLLARALLEQHGRKYDELSPSDRRRLARHRWPGNVRELKNVITRSCALSQGEGLLLVFDDGLAQSSGEQPFDDLLDLPLPEAREKALARFEQRYLAHALSRENGNVSAASRRAGVARSYFNKLLAKHPGARG
jgi:transcriptional regulator with PAS, ATPase and Fis domain